MKYDVFYRPPIVRKLEQLPSRYQFRFVLPPITPDHINPRSERPSSMLCSSILCNLLLINFNFYCLQRLFASMKWEFFLAA